MRYEVSWGTSIGYSEKRASWLARSTDRAREQQRDGDRQHPPRVDSYVRQQRRESDRERDAHRDAPVVADDEVPPEAAERADVPHAPAPDGNGTGRRRSA